MSLSFINKSLENELKAPINVTEPITDDDILKYNQANNEWENVPDGGSGSTSNAVLTGEWLLTNSAPNTGEIWFQTSGNPSLFTVHSVDNNANDFTIPLAQLPQTSTEIVIQLIDSGSFYIAGQSVSIVDNGSTYDIQVNTVTGFGSPGQRVRILFRPLNIPREIFDLDDAGLSGAPVVNQVLKYNGSEWQNANVALNEISDVNITGAQDQDSLVFDNASGNWVNQPQVTGGTLAITWDYDQTNQPPNGNHYILQVTGVKTDDFTTANQIVFNEDSQNSGNVQGFLVTVLNVSDEIFVSVNSDSTRFARYIITGRTYVAPHITFDVNTVAAQGTADIGSGNRRATFTFYLQIMLCQLSDVNCMPPQDQEIIQYSTSSNK